MNIAAPCFVLVTARAFFTAAVEALDQGEEPEAYGDAARDGVVPMTEALVKGNLLKRLNEWSRWDGLRKLGSSPFVRSSLAFAAAGYLLLWNEKFQDYLTIKFDTHFSLWRIWMIYYGGICLAVATGLYSCFCPRPIKDHASAFDLAQSECRHLVIMGLGPKYLADVKALEARYSMYSFRKGTLAPGSAKRRLA